MLMGETACAAGKAKPRLEWVSKHMAKLARLSKCVHVCVRPEAHNIMSECNLSRASLKTRHGEREKRAFCFLNRCFVCPCVCVFTVCPQIKSVNEWLKPGPGWAVKTAGCTHQLCRDNKINIGFLFFALAEAVSGNGCDWNAWSPMAQADGHTAEGEADDTQTRARWHTLWLLWANSLNYAGLHGIK